MAVALWDAGICSTPKWRNTVVRCSTSTRVPASRCGRWNITATRAYAVIGTNGHTPIIRKARVPAIVVSLMWWHTTIIRMVWQKRISCGGMNTGWHAPDRGGASIAAAQRLSSPIPTPMPVVRRTTAPAAMSMPCAYRKTHISAIR